MSYCLTYEQPHEVSCKKCKHKKIEFSKESMYFDAISHEEAYVICKEFLDEDDRKRFKRKPIDLIQIIKQYRT